MKMPVKVNHLPRNQHGENIESIEVRIRCLRISFNVYTVIWYIYVLSYMQSVIDGKIRYYKGQSICCIIK